MTAVMLSPAVGRRLTGPRRWFVWAGVGGAVVGLAAGVGMSAMETRSSRPSTATTDRITERQRADLTAFRAAIEPVISAGAQVVALGLQPGMTDIRDSKYAPDVLATMADGWVGELTSLHDQLQRVPAGGPLSAVHELYLRSLAGYLDVAKSLQAAAATVDQAGRADLLEQAASAGRAADRIFDRADAALKSLTAGSGPPQGE